MAPLIGPRINAIDGRAVESTDTALVLAVEGVVGQGGRAMSWSLERLSVPRSAVSTRTGTTGATPLAYISVPFLKYFTTPFTTEIRSTSLTATVKNIRQMPCSLMVTPSPCHIA